MKKITLIDLTGKLKKESLESLLDGTDVERVDNYAWYDGDFEEWLDENGIKMVAMNDNHCVFEDDSHFATVEYVEQENRFSYDCGDETIFNFNTVNVFEKF